MSPAAEPSAVVLVHEAELVNPRPAGGGQLRATCHLHGGDRQSSLSIALTGERVGLGYCHQCHVSILVVEMNPEAAARLARSERPRRTTQRRRQPPAADMGRAQLQATPPRRAASPTEWQIAELAQLRLWYPRMRERLTDARAVAYLAERGIPLECAQAFGVGYIPADARLPAALAKWRDRLVFPLGSPDGVGFIGRSLFGWQPGMDERVHKTLLEAPDTPRRWEKTNPAGWLGYANLATAGAGPIVLVEGPFDALALCAAGVPLGHLVALAGTAARPEWIPDHVRAVVLALDGDASGQQAAETLRQALRAPSIGLTVARCTPPDDGLGKDWSERWRVATWDGVAPASSAYADALEPLWHQWGAQWQRAQVRRHGVLSTS